MHRELVRFKHPDLVIEDHGIMILSLECEYESGGISGFPSYALDASMLYRLFGAVGVDSLSKLHGKSCWFVYEGEAPGLGSLSGNGLVAIEPLHKKDGKRFDIQEWRDWIKKNAPFSPYELREGKKPGAK